MAATESNIGKYFSQFMNWLAVPRVVTLPVLLLLCVGVSWLAWSRTSPTDVKVFAWASSMLTPFCMICATAVWGMRDKLDDQVDIDVMTSQAYARFVALAAKHRSRATVTAGITACSALVASGPAVSNQLAGPIWEWTFYLSAAAVAWSIYAYLLANYWEKQIRAYRSQQKLEAKKRQEKDSLISQIKGDVSASKVGRGWVDGPALSEPRKFHH